MKILFPSKTVASDVGGNSTYVNYLRRELTSLGVTSGIVGPKRSVQSHLGKLTHAVSEAGMVFRAGQGSDEILHFPSDTGPVVRGIAQSVVVTVHGVAQRHYHESRSPAAGRLWMMRTRAAISSADRVVTVSESSANDVSEAFGVPKSRIAVIPHGVDHDRFSPDRSRDPKVVLSQRLSSPYVLYLGNLDPRKNVQALVRATETRAWPQGVSLVVAGAHAWGQSDLLSQLVASERINYLGRVEAANVAPLMRHALCFLFPSWYEGFGLPVLEAMACGTPVITTARGSLGEVAGDAALLVEPSDHQQIAAYCADLAEDTSHRESRSSLGIERASRFTWSGSGRAHKELYERLSSNEGTR